MSRAGLRTSSVWTVLREGTEVRDLLKDQLIFMEFWTHRRIRQPFKFCPNVRWLISSPIFQSPLKTNWGPRGRTELRMWETKNLPNVTTRHIKWNKKKLEELAVPDTTYTKSDFWTERILFYYIFTGPRLVCLSGHTQSSQDTDRPICLGEAPTYK